MRRVRCAVIVVLLVIGVLDSFSIAANVTYDHRALVIDGKRRVLVSGSIHYPRSTPEMWPDLIQKSKDGGLDVIETYVFWNLHEPVRNQYDFEGRKDLVKFIKLVGAAGQYVHVRIGPYVCAEWNYGGFPVWLHFIPGIKFRTDNEPFKAEMKRFTAKIVDVLKQEKLYASQGGPVILSQIENEYGNVQSSFGSAAKSYVQWAATMATSLKTGVPWVMCNQPDAPDPIINTCNGFYCDQFTPNSKNKPKMWTENWSGWFLSFGGASPYRPVEDLAFAVARFYQNGGTFQNYYMYHGGTNFGRTTGGPFITTSYDYDAPIDEYGLVRQPKWGHLREVHKAIKMCEEALVSTEPAVSSLGQNLEGKQLKFDVVYERINIPGFNLAQDSRIFKDAFESTSRTWEDIVATVYKSGSQCSAFLANVDAQSDATVTFNGNSYHLPAWSVSILPDCKNVVLNTAKINSVTTRPYFSNQPLKVDVSTSEAFDSGWSWIDEPVGISKDNSFAKLGLSDQINTTADKSDYLWYSLSTDIKGDESFLENGSETVLRVDSLGHALHVFINRKLAGSGRGSSDNAKVSLEIPITLVPGKNTIDLLSLTVGLQNYGAFFELKGAGVTGPVKLESQKNGITVDISSGQWTYQIGLKGEDLGLSSGSSSQWLSQPSLPKNKPLTWYKTTFDAPAGSDPVALDFTGFGKGEAWINGQSIGRYWPSYIASGHCTPYCNYKGAYSPNKCLKNCGKPSQTFYHVPQSWLKPTGNTLVLFEEIGSDPTRLSFASKQIDSLCSHVSESHPPPVDMWSSDSKLQKSGPVLSLECPSPNQVISSIKFASFGTPLGTCGSFRHSLCSSQNALAIVQKACVGSKSCSVEVSIKAFGDPCRGKTKSLAVEASCE